MAATIVIYRLTHNKRSHMICDAMAEGIRAAGDRAIQRPDATYNGPEGDVALFYGFAGNLRTVFKDYRKEGKTVVHVDLGYWFRKGSNKYNGYHKLVVNDRHPTAYFQNQKHNHTRFDALGLEVKPWRRAGRHILVAGMSAKGANFEGFNPAQWEADATEKIKQYTDRPVIFRGKPNCPATPNIPGTHRQAVTVPLLDALFDCHAVVSHHSNVAIDGMIEGVPAFSEDGVATTMNAGTLEDIETPRYPNGRKQWLADIAWCQWTPREMQTGIPWRHLKDEGLI